MKRVNLTQFEFDITNWTHPRSSGFARLGERGVRGYVWPVRLYGVRHRFVSNARVRALVWFNRMVPDARS